MLWLRKTLDTKRVFLQAKPTGRWLGGLLLVLGFWVAPAGAASLTVNTLNDNTTNGDSLCTLREAITAANTNANFNDCTGTGFGNDTITFSVSGTITLSSTLPNIVDASTAGTLTIDGSGQSITISGDTNGDTVQDVRVMQVNSNGNLTLQNLTIAYGNGGSFGGGGIYNNQGILTLVRTTFSNNSTSGDGGAVSSTGVFTVTVSYSTFTNNNAGYGGAISTNGAGPLTVLQSSFSGNTAANGGGAISDWSAGTLTTTIHIDDSTFSNNVAAGGWGGGAIFEFGGTLLVRKSTFLNNRATGSSQNGGGISGAGGRVTVANSTFSGNEATNGGGVANNSGFLYVYNSTLSGNTASTNGGALYAWKSGTNPPYTEVYNSILANSTGSSSYDCFNGAGSNGTLIGGNNIIETTPTSSSPSSCSAIVFSTSDPQLGVLTGSPAYFPLSPASPAIDTGDSTICGNSVVNNQSQNGVTRPLDGNGDTVPICDIGSFEAPAAPAAQSDMAASLGSLPPSLSPGGSYTSLSFSCTNNGPDPATNATCSITASAGTVSGVSCNPPVPVGSLANGATINCTFNFTAPGISGGGDTPQTGVTFTVTAGASNDSNAANNTAGNTTPVPLVDALDDSTSFPASFVGATFNVGSNDQFGSGSLPPGASFTLLGATTCASASINSSGVATFNVPASGTCVVAYRVCVISGCDNAQLVVTVQQEEPIPTLDEWGFAALVLLMVGAGLLLVRRVVA